LIGLYDGGGFREESGVCKPMKSNRKFIDSGA
jgi:hypothetical protein